MNPEILNPKLMNQATIVGIDIGTTKVCTLIGEIIRGDEVRIMGTGIVPSAGIRKGVVVNVKEATTAISKSVHLAEKSSSYQVGSAYVSLAGGHIDSLNGHGTIAIHTGREGIQSNDINRALETAKAIDLPHNREILHVIPRNFTVDGHDGIQDPIGMHANRLEVEAHIVTGATSSINNLVKCVQNAQLNVDALVLEPLASSESVLTSMERQMGVILADIGGGTTDIAIFIEGSIWHTTVLETGGQQITNDIAVGLHAPFDVAESIKLKYGHAIPSEIDPYESIEVDIFGEHGRQKIPRQFITQIIQARTEEIFELILREVKRTGYDGLLTAGIVVCGGTANLTGIKKIGENIMNMPIRIGIPQGLRGVIDKLDDPAYATSVGLLEWGKHHEPHVPVQRQQSNSLKLPNWLRIFLPG